MMGFIRRLTGWKRVEPPVIDNRRWSEDWQAGDLAVCIDARWADPGPDDPKVGDMFRVRQVMDAVNHRNRRAIFLFFEGRVIGYCNSAFRKVRPVHDAADERFTRRLKQGKLGTLKVRHPVKVGDIITIDGKPFKVKETFDV